MKMVAAAPIARSPNLEMSWMSICNRTNKIEHVMRYSTLMKTNTLQADLATHKSQRIKATFHMNSLWLFYKRFQTRPHSSMVVGTGTMERHSKRDWSIVQEDGSLWKVTRTYTKFIHFTHTCCSSRKLTIKSTLSTPSVKTRHTLTTDARHRTFILGKLSRGGSSCWFNDVSPNPQRRWHATLQSTPWVAYWFWRHKWV